MSYRDVLVHLDRAPASARRLDAALALAHRFGSRLGALFAVADPTLPGVTSRRRLAFVAPDAADMEVAFLERAAAEGLDAGWDASISTKGVGVSQDVIRQARAYDLVVLGQFEPAADNGGIPSDLAEQTILRSGRPVLVIPFSGEHLAIGQRAVIAWNGSREAARSLHDALPLLRDAEQVTVLALVAAGFDNPFLDDKPDAIVQHLHRHGLPAEADRLVFDATAINAREQLLSYLADAGADLLVIGGPGQVGGAAQARRSLTRQLLANMTVPMLVSY